MNEKLSQEQVKLDRYVKSLEKKDIAIPTALDERISKKIDSLGRPKHYGRNMMVACIAVLVLFAGSVRLSPEFAAYAATVPGLRVAVEWLRGDAGIQQAREHGYSHITPITIEEEGYTLRLEEIFIDEDRIRLSAILLIGEETDALETPKQRTQEQPIRVGSPESLKSDDKPLHFSIKFTDFEPGGTHTSSDGSDTKNRFSRQVERAFEGGEVAAFLESNPQMLNIEAKIHRGKDLVHAFENIKLPIEASIFKLSHKFEQSQEISSKYGKIYIKEFIISPTRMRLDVGFEMQEGYFFTGFENHYLQDDKGKVYKAEGLVSKNWSEQARSMYFVPSVYFDTLPEKLYFCFDGIRIGSKEGQQFTLKLDDVYPKTIDYMGEEITIQSVKWHDTDVLSLAAKVPDQDVFRIQSFELKDDRGAKSWSEVEGVLTTNFHDVTYQDSYKVELEVPGYFIPLETKILLEMQ